MSKQLPKWFEGAPYSNGAVVRNPYSGEQYELNAVEFSIYEHIKKLEYKIALNGGAFNPKTAKLQSKMAKCLGWFRNNNAEAYMVLLD